MKTKLLVTIFMVSLSIILLFAYGSKLKLFIEKQACESRDGQWKATHPPSIWYCNEKTSDKGHACNDSESNQCEGQCLFDLSTLSTLNLPIRNFRDPHFESLDQIIYFVGGELVPLYHGEGFLVGTCSGYRVYDDSCRIQIDEGEVEVICLG